MKKLDVLQLENVIGGINCSYSAQQAANIACAGVGVLMGLCTGGWGGLLAGWGCSALATNHFYSC